MKTFDCFLLDFIIGNLSDYGLSEAACTLFQSYLSDRKQLVKLGQYQSKWLEIIKSVPQGSIIDLCVLVVEAESDVLIQWFDLNNMQANTEVSGHNL